MEKNTNGRTRRRILVASPVCQNARTLAAFLSSLKALRGGGARLDYIFVDDNTDQEAKRMLAEFGREGSQTVILAGTQAGDYVCDSESHHWNDALMLKVARYKNRMIRYALEQEYEELFFVDSDLVLYPGLLLQLESRNREIVAEVFWSRWHEGLEPQPNVWLFDEYDLAPKQPGEQLTSREQAAREARFLLQLRQPGLYEVGGLGACTLIRRSALLKGVDFSPIKNLTIHGEDRFFCIRAAVLGIDLFVDTCFPAYHIYRETDLAGVPGYVKQWGGPAAKGRVTLSMIVRNEEGRYLERVLKSLAGHIDAAVIIDDASTDGTAALCERLLAGVPLKLVRNEHSMFADEVSLRKKQWAETVATAPEWILNLDADELPEARFWEELESVTGDAACGRCDFRLYDMWNETQYREDAYWNAQASPRTFLLRYQPAFLYCWKETPQHCGRFPANCGKMPKAAGEYRVKHLGWSTEKDRQEKYRRYRRLDPGAVYGIAEQYESILDPEPRLLTWQDA